MAYKRHECATAIKIPGNYRRENMLKNVEVASFLGDILPISNAANEVEQSNPRVANLCRLHALDKVHQVDPKSRDRGIQQFKITLLHRVNKVLFSFLSLFISYHIFCGLALPTH
ncbi:hypothetical protein L1887_18251 [Cichorium endivia]|nr:hypothetical protein L1887_18251 [Cichorium endivia]